MNEIVAGMVSIALAIVGLAIIATLVSQRAQTGTVVQALTGGFATDIGAAVAPVTGSSITGVGLGSYGSGGFVG